MIQIDKEMAKRLKSYAFLVQLTDGERWRQGKKDYEELGLLIAEAGKYKVKLPPPRGCYTLRWPKK